MIPNTDLESLISSVGSTLCSIYYHQSYKKDPTDEEPLISSIYDPWLRSQAISGGSEI